MYNLPTFTLTHHFSAPPFCKIVRVLCFILTLSTSTPTLIPIQSMQVVITTTSLKHLFSKAPMTFPLLNLIISAWVSCYFANRKNLSNDSSFLLHLPSRQYPLLALLQYHLILLSLLCYFLSIIILLPFHF